MPPSGNHDPLALSLPPHTTVTLTQFLQDRLQAAGGKGFVLGLSGGLDSAVVAALCAQAIGPENVLALSMPVREVHSTELARDWARQLGIGFELMGLDELYKKTKDSLEPFMVSITGVREPLPPARRQLVEANALARLRMVLLYSTAQARGYLVAGTSNKSELLTGYFTKWGDGASDVAPIGDLYKTQVERLAGELGVPKPIRTAPPSAELWEGQTDEQELGLSYDELDRILYGIEQKLPYPRIAELTGQPAKEVERIALLVRHTAHKRKLPLIPKLGLRTVGIDWREVVGVV